MVEVEDPTTSQMLLLSAKDVGPTALLVPCLWLLRGFMRSVSDGDPADIGVPGFSLPLEAMLGGLAAFVLAHVFAYGLELREDVEGTV